MDRGAWWAAVHGVAQSRTRQKRLNMHACTGEGNSNPLQYSCLENSGDRGAWWADVYGVSQSRARLKRFSSSSSSSSSWRKDRLPSSVFLGFPCDSAGKESTRNAGDPGSIPAEGKDYAVLLWNEHWNVKVAQSCQTLCDPWTSPWNSPGQNTGVRSLSASCWPFMEIILKV